MDEVQAEIINQASLLVWKVMYYTFDRERALGKELRRLGGKARKSFQDRAFRVCMNYIRARYNDRLRSFAPKSTFHLQLAEFLFEIARPGGIYLRGAPKVATGFATCLLRFEGWRVIRDGQDEAEFERELESRLRSAEEKITLLPSIVADIRRFWTFEGDPDESVFNEVIDFRERQGKNLMELIA
jgi:hypothetical protein